MSTAEKVLAELAKITGTDEVTKNPELRLYDLHILDSLGTVELMVALSEEFAVNISPAEFEVEQWSTPGKLVAYMEQRVGR